MAEAVPKLVKGMVASLTERLFVPVAAHKKTRQNGQEVGCLAAGVSAMNEKMKAQEVQSEERDRRSEAQLEMLGARRTSRAAAA